MTSTKTASLFLGSLGVVLAIGGAIALGQQPKPASAPSASAAAQGFPDLVSGLKATPGCLGVETAKTDSGKNVIFAWFKDKKAALDWYYSDMHQKAMDTFFPGIPHREPLKDIKDDAGPIMAIASITPGKAGNVPGTSLPISRSRSSCISP